MKLFHIIRPNAFFLTLDQCEGPVFLTAPDGRKVSWQEFRSQPAISAASVLPEVEVTVSNSDDIHRLLRFAMDQRPA